MRKNLTVSVITGGRAREHSLAKPTSLQFVPKLSDLFSMVLDKKGAAALILALLCLILALVLLFLDH
jgi:hypothetical protein